MRAVPVVWLIATVLAGAIVSVDASSAAADGEQAVGTIVGRVRLSGPAPSNPVVRMGLDPACSRAYGDTRPTHDFVMRAPDGGLANVFVEVRGPFPGAPAPASPAVLDQRGCMFHPRVLAMQRGQLLEVRNGDPTSHNVHALSTRGNAFNVSQVVGRPPYMVTMAHEEKVLRVTCDVHSWMNVYVAVVDHPFFAVTGGDGSFVIGGVPAGRHVLQVWHERYGPLTASAAVVPGGETPVEFTYTGAERAAPPAP